MHLRLLALLALAAAPPAQTCIYNGPNDPLYSQSGTTSAIGIANHRRQFRVPAVLFQNLPLRITGLSFAMRGGWVRYRCDHLTVRMGQTTVGQLTNTFAQNITSPLQTVLSVDDHDWLFGPGPSWTPIGLQQPFQFLPGQGDLLVEIQTTNCTEVEAYWATGAVGAPYGEGLGSPSSSPGGAVGVAPLVRLCVDRPEVLLHGQNCQGSAGTAPLLGISGTPTPGALPVFWLSNAPPNGIAVAAFGFDNAPPFPIDLTPFGAPGCAQYFPLVLLAPVLTDNLGIGQHALPLAPSPAVIGDVILGQYFVLDPGANALGITASNYGRILIGQ